MKKSFFILCLVASMAVQAQTDTDKLALAIRAADEANTKQLMQYVWKRKTDVAVDGVVNSRH